MLLILRPSRGTQPFLVCLPPQQLWRMLSPVSKAEARRLTVHQCHTLYCAAISPCPHCVPTLYPLHFPQEVCCFVALLCRHAIVPVHVLPLSVRALQIPPPVNIPVCPSLCIRVSLSFFKCDICSAVFVCSEVIYEGKVSSVFVYS